MASHFLIACRTLLCSPARGGSTTATSESAPFRRRSRMSGKASSALPHMNSTFSISFKVAFFLASSIAFSTHSTPKTREKCLESARPIVPVPQHTSKRGIFENGAGGSVGDDAEGEGE